MNLSRAQKDKLYKLLVARNEYVKYEYTKMCQGVKLRSKEKIINIALLSLKYLLVPWFMRPIFFKKTKLQVALQCERKQLQNEVSWRRPVHLFVKDFLEYDVISFDVFDTLILRPLIHPTHLFMLLGIKYKMMNFVAIRKKAEIKAKKLAEDGTGSREITLHDIYREVSLYTGIDAAYGANVEFETELELCFANEYMKTVFNILKGAGKRLIAISDMYLPREMISELLKNCGYEGFEEIFVSNEFKHSKREKELYMIANASVVQGAKVIHIGDNHLVDYLNAKDCGWDALYYKGVHQIGNYYRPAVMSPLIGSAYSGVVNTYLNNGILKGTFRDSQHYRYGFIYGGLFVLGFAVWIHDFAIKNNVDKVLFIARDGYIVKKVYEMLFTDIPCEYVLWSRSVAIRAGHKKNRYEFLRQFFIRRIQSNPTWTVKQAFESAGLEFLLPELKLYEACSASLLETDYTQMKFKIDEECLLSTIGLEAILLEFLYEKWNKVQRQFDVYTEVTRRYVHPMVKGCKNVCTVDTGWRGTGPMALKYLIEEEWEPSCKVTGLMAGTFRSTPDANSGQLADKSLETYLFSPIHNTDLEAFHISRALIHNTCIELFTTAPHPSLSKIVPDEKDGYTLVFDRPEVENYTTINTIHQGIVDFVKEYTSRFKKFPELFSISGSDAYAPIKHVLEETNFRYVLEIFKDYVYNRYVGGLEHTTNIQTFAEMVKEDIEKRD